MAYVFLEIKRPRHPSGTVVFPTLHAALKALAVEVSGLRPGREIHFEMSGSYSKPKEPANAVLKAAASCRTPELR